MSTILIAEDNAALRGLLCRALEEGCHETLPAADGIEAVRIAAQRLDAVDLVILDIQMPGLEGPEVWQVLKSQRADLKVLFISGHSNGQGLDGPLLRKPFTTRALLDAVRGLLASPNR